MQRQFDNGEESYENRKTVKFCLLIVVLCLVSLSYVGQTQALEEFIHVDIEPYSNTKLVWLRIETYFVTSITYQKQSTVRLFSQHHHLK